MLVDHGDFQLITGPRGTQVPSCILSTNDIVVSKKGTKCSLDSFMNLFKGYSVVSG